MNTRAPRKYLLKGLVRCGLCGAPLVSRPTGEHVPKMVCARGPGFHGCGHLAVLAEPLEALVSEAVINSLDSPRLERTLRERAGADTDATIEKVQQDLEDARRRLEELATIYGHGEITLAEWQAARQPTEAIVQRAERQLAEAARMAAVIELVRPSGGDLRGRWPTLALGRRRAVIDALIVSVTVAPGLRGLNRFDPRRVTIEWRA